VSINNTAFEGILMLKTGFMKSYSKEELMWIDKLQQVADSMPKSLSIFVNESGISVFKGELPITEQGGVNSRIEHKIVRPKNGLWECGAW
jgi:hypothetical protein